MKAYKLFRLRKDGTLGPLFINRRQRITLGEWLPAESHPTKGFAVRPGWHCSHLPHAPHLSDKDRVWCEVEVTNADSFERPWNQGGLWYIAKVMKVLRILSLQERVQILERGL
jgi:hypothetical protein